jgi:hypothetical protein
MILNVSDREFHTILAALRHYQEDVVDRYHPNEDEIATNGGKIEPLNVVDIDQLCERINFPAPEPHYIIIATVEGPTEYWNNEEGWCEFRDSSTVFTLEERNDANLPIGGAWVQLLDDDVITCNCGESFTCGIAGDWDEWENHAQNCDLHMPDLTD